MKFLLIALALIVTSAQAAELNLQSGESVTLQPNVMTTVTCSGGSGGPCAEAASALKLLIETCRTEYNANYCLDKYWPAFKSKNPSCVNSALKFCIETCRNEYSANYCADKCTK